MSERRRRDFDGGTLVRSPGWKPPTTLRNACLHLRNRVAGGSSVTRLMERYSINVVLDVGANVGQYSRRLIRDGYRGRIVSFEPLPDAYRDLEQSSWGFRSWDTVRMALGDSNSRSTLYIAGNSMSSSLQPMLREHLDAAPESAYVDACDVTVRRLDCVFDEYVAAGDRCFVKLDVQGHERQVIAGAKGCLNRIVGLQIELSMMPLYEGQETWQDAIEALEDLGFQLASLEPGFTDRRTGVMLQADGIFIRTSLIEALRTR